MTEGTVITIIVKPYAFNLNYPLLLFKINLKVEQVPCKGGIQTLLKIAVKDKII